MADTPGENQRISVGLQFGITQTPAGHNDDHNLLNMKAERDKRGKRERKSGTSRKKIADEMTPAKKHQLPCLALINTLS
jgi:hypothetical protein